MQLSFEEKLYEKESSEKKARTSIKHLYHFLVFCYPRTSSELVSRTLKECSQRIGLILGSTIDYLDSGIQDYYGEKIIDSRAVSEALRAIYTIVREYELSDFENNVIKKVINELEYVK